jgi:hypothetical protein
MPPSPKAVVVVTLVTLEGRVMLTLVHAPNGAEAEYAQLSGAHPLAHPYLNLHRPSQKFHLFFLKNKTDLKYFLQQQYPIKIKLGIKFYLND